MNEGALPAVWSLLGTAAGAVGTPADLPGGGWVEAAVPGTVASALNLPLGGGPDLDAQDWWYRCAVEVPAGGPWRLRFEGLATLVEGWLDGAPLFRSRNSFREVVAELPEGATTRELVLAFRALAPELAVRRPRPRWKTALVEQQNLRWVRTSLHGRIPGWTPPLPAVGPWRAVHLERGGDLRVAVLAGALPGGVPTLTFRGTLAGLPAGSVAALHVAGVRLPVAVGEGGELVASGEVPGAAGWWPHTHGEPVRHEVRLVMGDGRAFGVGAVGFRSVSLRGEDGNPAFVVNGRPVFARGAVLHVVDVRSLDGCPGQAAALVAQAREAGANLLRVGGTGTWASRELLEAASAAGVMLWQDLPLANMDYPFEDPAFAEELDAELDENFLRLARHPAVAVICGGSEVAQQAAMMGLPVEAAAGGFYEARLPGLVSATMPGVAVVPHTPFGGALPFHTATGFTHYYGLGAYRRPLADVRRAGVKFTAECLGFSNVPEEANVWLVKRGSKAVPHHPAWKEGVPRDNTAGWDFEDVRDHYLPILFGESAVELRSVDPERYLALSRVVTGELMLRAFAEWRRAGSACAGALVWMLRDQRPGAGWGVLDSTDRPKAAWWYLRRAWAGRAVLLTDEGLDGLDLHVVNEGAAPLPARLELELWGRGPAPVEHASIEVEVAGGSVARFGGDALLGHFADLAWAYRFGPPRHDCVVARLRTPEGSWLHDDVIFRPGAVLPSHEVSVLSVGVAGGEAERVLTLATTAMLQAVALTAEGWEPDDNYLHLAPGCPREVRFRPVGAPRAFRVEVSALNLRGTVNLRG